MIFTFYDFMICGMQELKILPSSLLRLRQKKALHTTFLQYDTLIITTDIFNLYI